MNTQINNEWVAYSYSSDFKVSSIKRLRDTEVFSVGDLVTNGTRIRGKILEFNLHNDSTVFVVTDWSNIGIRLDTIYKITKKDLENHAIEVDDIVECELLDSSLVKGVRIIQMHISRSENKYDLELVLEGGITTRIYNIGSKYVKHKIK